MRNNSSVFNLVSKNMYVYFRILCGFYNEKSKDEARRCFKKNIFLHRILCGLEYT